MRTAETVLNIIRDRGQRGLPLDDLYRQLYNPDLYLRAYGKLYANPGADQGHDTRHDLGNSGCNVTGKDQHHH